MNKNLIRKLDGIMLEVLWAEINQQQLIQERLASKLGVSQSFLSKIKNQRKKGVDLGELWYICKELNISWPVLLERFNQRVHAERHSLGLES